MSSAINNNTNNVQVSVSNSKGGSEDGNVNKSDVNKQEPSKIDQVRVTGATVGPNPAMALNAKRMEAPGTANLSSHLNSTEASAQPSPKAGAVSTTAVAKAAQPEVSSTQQATASKAVQQTAKTAVPKSSSAVAANQAATQKAQIQRTPLELGAIRGAVTAKRKGSDTVLASIEDDAIEQGHFPSRRDALIVSKLSQGITEIFQKLCAVGLFFGTFNQ